MSTPFEDPLLVGTRDIGIAVPTPDLHPEPVIDETIVASDWALHPWRCQACGATDHRRIDTEEI